MRGIFIIIFLMFSFSFSAQSVVEINVKGIVRDYTNKANLFGTTLYIIQNGTVCGKAVSESNGSYYLAGNVNTELPFEILSSKPGYATKKVLINLQTVKLKKAKNVSFQIAEELSFMLYKNLENADLSFSKNEYAEKFNWDESQFKIVPEGIEKTMDQRADRAYDNAKSLKNANTKDKDSSQIADNDQSIESQIQEAITKGNNFLNSKQYKDAIAEFEKVSGLASNHSNKGKISSLLSQSTAGLKQSKDKQTQEDQVFNDQLNIAKNKISEGRSGLKKAGEVLNSNPMKGRANDPEVVRLQLQIDELTSFYSEYDKAFDLLKQDTSAALLKLNSVYNQGLKNSKFTPASDISSLKTAITNIQKAQSKVSNTTQNTNVKILSNPGEKTQKDPKLVLNDLDQTAKENAEKPQIDVADQINALEYENSMNSKLNLARSEQTNQAIKELITEGELLNLEEDSANISRQYEIEKQNKEYNYAVFQRDSTALKLSYDQTDQLKELKNGVDSINFEQKIYLDTLQAQTMENFRDFQDQMDLAQVQKDSLSNNRLNDLDDKLQDNSYAIFQRDSSALFKTYEQMERISKMKDNKDSLNYEQQLYLNQISENQVAQINAFNHQKDVMNLKEDSLALQRQYEMEGLNNDFTYFIFQRDSSALKQTYTQSNIIKDMSNTNDVLAKSRKSYLDSLQMAHVKEVYAFENAIDLDRLIEDSLSYKRFYDVSDAVRQNEAEKASSLERERVQREARMLAQREIEQYQPVFDRQPNNLADANGNLYSKGAVHEEVFEIKNDLGYVETVIIRRVVVDHIGYGVVFEMVRNENGSNYYTKNGSIITEHEWTTQSSRAPKFN